jgi:hypothetical protein
LNTKTRNIVIGCVVLIIVACIGSAVLAAFAGGALGSLFTQAVDGPFKIARRPMPSGTVVDNLLPVSVGPFTRAKIEPDPSGGATATYQDGRSVVVVLMTPYASVDDARQAVAQVRKETETSGGTRSYAVGMEPSYAYVPGLGRMAWSRGGYFFDARASNQSDLDRFMEKFPY